MRSRLASNSHTHTHTHINSNNTARARPSSVRMTIYVILLPDAICDPINLIAIWYHYIIHVHIYIYIIYIYIYVYAITIGYPIHVVDLRSVAVTLSPIPDDQLVVRPRRRHV